MTASEETNFTGKGQLGKPVDATTRVMLLAVEVLLTDPEALRNDALEGDLYILRDQLAERVPK
jgi:hypothetical protein